MPLHSVPQDKLRDQLRRRLEALESWLRRLIHEELTQHLGSDYLGACLPNGDFVLAKHLRSGIANRFKRCSGRYARPIDAADFKDMVDILTHVYLYDACFQPALKDRFEWGRMHTRTILERLTATRNALAHGNPISIHQAEQVLAYSSDFVETLRSHYVRNGMANDYNVPTIISVSDSLGFNAVRPVGISFWQIDRKPTGGDQLRPGERISFTVEVDPAFPPDSYRIKWSNNGGMSGDRSRSEPIYVVDLLATHVSDGGFRVICKIITHAEWHRHSDYDDHVSLQYRVLPPL